MPHGDNITAGDRAQVPDMSRLSVLGEAKTEKTPMKNIVILAPPLCGARILAEHLVQAHGYQSGEPLPCRYDPSLLSHEDKTVVYINQRLLNEHRPKLGWTTSAADNWILPFPDKLPWKIGMEAMSEDHQDSILMKFNNPQPYVFKDPQFLHTIFAWMPVLNTDTRFVMLNRFPIDWVASVLDGCDREDSWHHVPKHPDYLFNVWAGYTANQLRLERAKAVVKRHANGDVEAQGLMDLRYAGRHVQAFTLNQLCVQKGWDELAAYLELPAGPSPFAGNKITHHMDRTKASMPKEGWAAWDDYMWRTTVAV